MNYMSKTAIELIQQERSEHNNKHGYSTSHDVEHIDTLCRIAALLMEPDESTMQSMPTPYGVDEEKWDKMRSKPHIDRVIIVGSLCAAIVDAQMSVGDIPQSVQDNKKEILNGINE